MMYRFNALWGGTEVNQKAMEEQKLCKGFWLKDGFILYFLCVLKWETIEDGLWRTGLF